MNKWAIFTAVALAVSLTIGPLAVVGLAKLAGATGFEDQKILAATGFTVVWIIYGAICLAVAGLDAGSKQYRPGSQNRHIRRWWIALQLLACVGIAYVLRPWVTGIFIKHNSPGYILENYILNPLGDNLTLILWTLACAAAIARRQWAARLVCVASVWRMAIELPYLPDLLRNFYVVARSHRIPILTAMLKHSGSWYIYLVVLAGLIITGGIIARNQPATKTHGQTNRLLRGDRLIVTGLAAMLVGIAFRGTDISHIRLWNFADITSAIMVLAAISVMTGQFLFRGPFAAAAALTGAVVLMTLGFNKQSTKEYTDTLSLLRTVIIWAPLILAGLISVFNKKNSLRLRLLAPAVPVVLMLLSCTVPGLLIPQTSPLKTSAVRPADFPDYVTLPPDASPAYYTTDKPCFAGVGFEVDQPYPATATLTWISMQFQQAGFTTMDYMLWAPQTRSSHLTGWQIKSYGSVKKPSPADEPGWEGYWINKDRGIVARVFAGYSHLYRKITPAGNRILVDIEFSSATGLSRRAILLRRALARYDRMRPPKP